MNDSARVTAPRWYSIGSSLFLVWNLFGLVVFIMATTVFRKRESLRTAGLNEEQIDLTLATPAWVNVAFGFAVVFGVAGCLALLLKSRLAVPLLLVSLAGVLVQNTYMYFLSDTIRVMGPGASPFVILGAIALIPYATYGSRNGWLEKRRQNLADQTAH